MACALASHIVLFPKTLVVYRYETVRADGERSEVDGYQTIQ